MITYILIAEIKCLRIPCSLQVKYDEFLYYLYPNDIVERVENLKSKLKDINKYFRAYQNEPIKNDQVIIKDEPSSTLIITEIQESDNSLQNKSFSDISKFFYVILKALNILYTYHFNIERISIFKKIGNISKLVRLIENHPETEINVTKGIELLENIDVRYFEPFLPIILNKLSEHKQYLDIFDEYINGKMTEKFEYKIVYLWNTLEHISERYLKTKKKNKLIRNERFDEIINIITNKMNEFTQSDLVFSENIDKAKEILISKMNNYPQIVDKILYMLRNLNLFSNDIEDIIRKIYYLRNRIFHSGIYLPLLLSKFENRFSLNNPITIKDLEDLLEDFEILINKILVNVFELDHLFEVNKTKKLAWIQQFSADNSFFNYLITMSDGRKIEQVSDLVHSGFRSEIQLESYVNKTIEYLSRKGKYLKLLKFLSEFLIYWRMILSSNYITSYTSDYKEKFLIKFEDELTLNFVISNNTKFIQNLINLINSEKTNKNPLFITYIYLLNHGTIQLKLQLSQMVQSLEYFGETRGELYCYQLDYGCEKFDKFDNKKIKSKGKCEKCNGNIKEVGIINPEFFGEFFPITILYYCKKCRHISIQEKFTYPIISEQFVQIPIRIMDGEKIIRKGNGFFFSLNNDTKAPLFFITTYKNLTGSFPPDDNNRTGESARLLFHASWDNLEEFIEIEIPLYTQDNTPIWIQNEKKSDVDIAVIPIFPNLHWHSKISALNRKNLKIPSNLSNNLLLVVIGFEHGIISNKGIPQVIGFPTLKDEFLNLIEKQSISIEPYEGMEGSPVFIVNNNIEDQSFQAIFLGIYSDFSNGIILQTDLIIEIINTIDLKKYMSEIISNLPFTHKIHFL